MVEREKAWLKLLELPSMKGVNNLKQVKRLCREGLPSSLRGKIWTKLILEGRQREPELFDALMTKQNAMVDTNIDIFDVIERDVMRCYPQHSMFSDYEGHGVRNLRGILRCYALYNPLLGYTQGMGFIVGMLMMHITSTEDVFWVLVGMLEGVCKGFYDPDLKRVRMDARVFDVLLRNMDTKLSIYFETNQIDGLMFIPQWFLTLFTSCLPWPSVLRIWDMFICEGSKALFRMSLALLIASKEHLLMRCPSNSEALSFILHLPRDDPKFQPEALSKLMMKIRLRSRNLQKLRLHVEENTDSRGRNI
ncbi:rab-GTPase-TBC domain-containing protein [Chytriomyces sp. MP71]|nr:rab-GTPase-TBC domain-containing protein [Chytriomyces sp. MP71]